MADRSRIWLDDQSWWLGIAEFKPYNRKPVTYLNVGLMFLWHAAFRSAENVVRYLPSSDRSAQAAFHSQDRYSP